ncbi:MAG: DUF485 domain-containing protein [Helicobacter sp.]|nr:DUF485 domain-containing protein [Helicobacter sp.]
MKNKQDIARRTFLDFVTRRNKISLLLMIIMFIVYYFLVIGIGFFPSWLGSRIFDSSITIGIVLGIGTIIIGFILCGIYTFYANKNFDEQQNACIAEFEECGILDHCKEHGCVIGAEVPSTTKQAKQKDAK